MASCGTDEYKRAAFPGVYLTEVFLDALDVIVVLTAGLTTFEHTLQHGFLVCREEEHQR